MGLPVTRDITAAADVQIPSTLLNNLQDAVVGAKHGSITKFFPITNPGVTATWDDQSVKGLDTTIKPQCDITLPEGTRITALIPYVTVANGDSIQIQLVEQTYATGSTAIDSDAPTSSTSNGYEGVPFTTALPYIVPAGKRVTLFFNTQHADHKCWGAAVTYEKP